MAELENTGVASRPGRKARPDLGKQARQRLAIFDPPLHQPSRVQIAAPGQGDELLREWPQLLGFGFGRDDPPVREVLVEAMK